MSVPNSEEIRRLVSIHNPRYQGMIDRWTRGDQSMVIRECCDLLDVWRSIKDKGFDWNRLDSYERGEITDAIESGE